MLLEVDGNGVGAVTKDAAEKMLFGRVGTKVTLKVASNSGISKPAVFEFLLQHHG